jgi:hypothetical protein
MVAKSSAMAAPRLDEEVDMQHDEFVGQVQARARLADTGRAESAIRATLETLGERIPEGLAETWPRNCRGRSVNICGAPWRSVEPAPVSDSTATSSSGGSLSAPGWMSRKPSSPRVWCSS